MEFARSPGKQAVACKDNSGSIVNRLLVPYVLDAIRALESEVGGVSAGHSGRKSGRGFYDHSGREPVPVTLASSAGRAVAVAASRDLGAPPPVLRRPSGAGPRRGGGGEKMGEIGLFQGAAPP